MREQPGHFFVMICLERLVSHIKCYGWLAEVSVTSFMQNLTPEYGDQHSTMGEYWISKVDSSWKTFVEVKLKDTNYINVLIDLISFGDAESHCQVQMFISECLRLSFASSRPREEDTNMPASETGKRKTNERVKDKKRYEVDKLISHLESIMSQNDLRLGVDVGCGQGYLSLSLLERNAEFKVVALENQDSQVCGVHDRIESNKNNLNGRLSVSKKWVDKNTRIFGVNDDSLEPYIIYSLHACGSLSDSMLEIYCKDPAAKALCNVGCCYNLMDDSFPSSAQVREALRSSDWKLTPNAKMAACQAPQRWPINKKKVVKFMKRHFYRALIEPLIAKLGISSDKARIGNIPDSDLISFGAYSRRAFHNMGLNFCPFSQEFLQIHHDNFVNYEPWIAFFWTTRAAIGVSIEALILLDRYFLLCERLPVCSKSTLTPVFNSVTSPRNMAIISEKISP